MIKIKVTEIIGEYAIDIEDGKKLHEVICFYLSSGQEIELDFTDILVFNVTFFCYAIAQLFRNFEPRELDLLIKFTISPEKAFSISSARSLKWS